MSETLWGLSKMSLNPLPWAVLQFSSQPVQPSFLIYNSMNLCVSVCLSNPLTHFFFFLRLEYLPHSSSWPWTHSNLSAVLFKSWDYRHRPSSASLSPHSLASTVSEACLMEMLSPLPRAEQGLHRSYSQGEIKWSQSHSGWLRWCLGRAAFPPHLL